MKHLIGLMCLMMLAAAPLSMAQDKAKPVAPKGAQEASDKAKGSPMQAEMSAKGEQARKEADAKQKAKLARKSCEKQAKAQKLKSEERKKFIKDCMMR